ncbi:iron complex transport system permease protein [Crossiella equi]|uniref:Iron complex transport system permease protein n=1 Tax=Crossiella equi TaxID=130796 RepID=A0ABS5AEJ2_9PSEU|nr:iron ABC transporter permease [Crossiella equi]MBP2475004.1 iron complex transport system permease protein [Crossiella equi]
MRRLPLGLTLTLAFLLLLLLASVALSFGSVAVPVGQVWRIVGHWVLPGLVEPDWTPVRAAIIRESRLPRVVLAVLVGAALALGGAVAQVVTRNPLADPYLLGVNSGAGFVVALVVVLGIGAGVLGAATIPVAAFLGALVALLVVLAVAGRFGSPTALVLGGLAVGQIFGAGITLVIFLFSRGDQAKQVLFWLTGGLGDARWSTMVIPAAVLVLCLGAGMALGRWLNLLHAGDDGAAALGVNPKRLRLLTLVAVALLAGTSVAVAGGIGFVGLIVPQAAAFLVGADARRLLPVSALLGAVFLVAADLFARVAVSPLEIPVGAVTSAIGGAVFLVMLYRRRGRAT